MKGVAWPAVGKSQKTTYGGVSGNAVKPMALKVYHLNLIFFMSKTISNNITLKQCFFCDVERFTEFKLL